MRAVAQLQKLFRSCRALREGWFVFDLSFEEFRHRAPHWLLISLSDANFVGGRPNSGSVGKEEQSEASVLVRVGCVRGLSGGGQWTTRGDHRGTWAEV